MGFEAVRSRPDMNWVITNDLESLKQYAETFNLGPLVALDEKLPAVKEEDIVKNGMLGVMSYRNQVLHQMASEPREQITYYSLVSDADWVEMRAEMTRTIPPATVRRRLTDLANSPSAKWVSKFLMDRHMPSVIIFLMTNSAFIGEDVFWPLRTGASGVWDGLIAENVDPRFQFPGRK